MLRTFVDPGFIPYFLPGTPASVGLTRPAVTLSMEDFFLVLFRLRDAFLRYSASGFVDDENANTRTSYAASGLARSHRLFWPSSGRPGFFDSGFFPLPKVPYASPPPDDQFVENIRQVLATPVTLLFYFACKIRETVRTLDTGDLVLDETREVAPAFAPVPVSAPGFSSPQLFFTDRRSSVSFALGGTDGCTFWLDPNDAPAGATQRSGTFLGQPMAFWVQPGVSVSLSVSFGEELPF